MAYDEALAQRVRELVAGGPELTEMKMFGGLAFLIHGNMAVAVSGQGGLMIRVDPVETQRLIGESVAEPMEMRGRAMSGWLRVAAEHLVPEHALERWVEVGIDYASELPPK